MNLLLHGLESPDIDPGNALRFPLKEIGDRERMDVILSNPPFGGEEERGIWGNFPDDKQTSETALLFLQLIMRKLRRQPAGRAAVVVPNGTLFADGICGRIKQELLQEFNLHTIVRLPNGVFAPYTNIPANLLFFDRTGPTKDVWFYEQPLPEDRKNYTKTQPLQYDELSGQTLMVVDDAPELVSMVEKMVRGLGYSALGYTDSIAALQALLSGAIPFAAVITDEVMPGLSGTKLTEALRQNAFEIPVLLLSGYGGPLLAARAAASGVTQVLIKPIGRADLARALSELLG